MNYLNFFAKLSIICSIIELKNGQSTSCTTDDYKYMSTKTDYNLIGNNSNFNSYTMPSIYILFFIYFK